MSEDEVDNQPEDQAPDSQGTSRWRKVLVAIAVLFLVVGFSMKGEAQVVPEQVAGPTAEGVQGTNSLVAGEQNPDVWDGARADRSEESTLSSYSPFFIKGGFSFLIAFCVGLAVRMFFKVTALFVGVLALALFALNKMGWVDVDWQTMSDQWDSVGGKIAGQADSVKAFITGSLPAAGMGSLGLFTGFKKG